jgi:16S rRNA G966 N2-methylase RsmD
MKSQQSSSSEKEVQIKKRVKFERVLSISKEDPFALVFIDPDIIRKQIAYKLADYFRVKN